MSDAPGTWATIQIRVPRDLYNRWEEQIQRIARLSHIDLGEEHPNSNGQRKWIYEVILGLLDVPDAQLQRWLVHGDRNAKGAATHSPQRQADGEP